MNKELMFNEVRQLCMITGKAIDKIAKDTDISQDLVAKMFIETLQTTLDKMADTKDK